MKKRIPKAMHHVSAQRTPNAYGKMLRSRVYESRMPRNGWKERERAPADCTHSDDWRQMKKEMKKKK